jgi:hypothetical protein
MTLLSVLTLQISPSWAKNCLFWDSCTHLVLQMYSTPLCQNYHSKPLPSPCILHTTKYKWRIIISLHIVDAQCQSDDYTWCPMSHTHGGNRIWVNHTFPFSAQSQSPKGALSAVPPHVSNLLLTKGYFHIWWISFKASAPTVHWAFLKCSACGCGIGVHCFVCPWLFGFQTT